MRENQRNSRGIRRARAAFLIVFFILAFFVVKPLLAVSQDEVFSSEFEVKAGILYGSLGEYVFRSTGETLSYLDWDLAPLGVTQMEAEVRLPWRLWLGGGLTLGFPSRTGIMEDSDWENADEPDLRTKYSRHDCYTQGASLWRAEGGGTFYEGDSLRLRGSLGFLYYNFVMDGRDGYYDYTVAGGGEGDMYGTVISYQQLYSIIFAGLEGRLQSPRGLWRVTAGGRISPFAYCQTLDNHHDKDMDYYDIMDQGGLYWNLFIRGEVAPLPAGRFVLEAGYEGIPVMKGYSLVVATSGASAGEIARTADGTAGASLGLWRVFAGYRF